MLQGLMYLMRKDSLYKALNYKFESFLALASNLGEV